jgi:hypothetical protein
MRKAKVHYVYRAGMAVIILPHPLEKYRTPIYLLKLEGNQEKRLR